MASTILSAAYDRTNSAKKTHYHDSHDILYVTHGSAMVMVNGTQHQVGPGQLAIFSRFEQHSVTDMSEDYTRYVIQISPVSVSGSRKALRLFSVLSNRPEGFSNVLDMGQDGQSVQQILQRMVLECRNEGHWKEECLELLLQELLILICRNCPDVSVFEENSTVDMVARLQDRLASQLQDRHSLEELAREFGVSPSSLSHSFKRITGIPVMEYLLYCRLAAAKEQLAHSDLSIGRIVELCGFTDGSNFGRVFRQRTGMSPSDFRKQYR
jgi:AraC-like DNA-binding protein